MKKILALILAALMSLSLLCACTDTPENPSVDGSIDSSVQQSTESETDVSSSDTVTDTDDAPTSSVTDTATDVTDSTETTQATDTTQTTDTESTTTTYPVANEVLNSVGTLRRGDTIRGTVLEVFVNGNVRYARTALEQTDAETIPFDVALIVCNSSLPTLHAGISISFSVDNIIRRGEEYLFSISRVESVAPVKINYEAPAVTHVPEDWEYYEPADYDDYFLYQGVVKDGVKGTVVKKETALYFRIVGFDGMNPLLVPVPNFTKGESAVLTPTHTINGLIPEAKTLRTGDYILLAYRKATTYGPYTVVVPEDIYYLEEITSDTEKLYQRTSDPDYDALGGRLQEGYYFYARVTKVSSTNRLTVEMMPEIYGFSVGEKAYVELPDHEILVKKGEYVGVRVKSVKSGKTPTITASSVVVGDFRIVENIIEFTFWTRYAIPDISLFTFPKNFPEFPNGEIPKDVFGEPVKRSFSDYFRVVRVDGSITYLAACLGTPENTVTVAVVGKLPLSLKAGDHLSLKGDQYYLKNIDGIRFWAIPADAITEAKKVTGDDRYAAYHITWDKPVIYLYPEEDTVCSVKVDLDGELTCTYPDHGTAGWQNFIAKPDGTLIFPDGREYYCLYWEGKGMMDLDLSRGFCVKGSDTAAFLERILAEIGLTPREANEFIIYWLPLMQNNEYNLISFQHEVYTSAARLEITPTPDSLLRVYMVYQPLDAPVEIEPQTFETFERKGFTVVEWGGGKLS